MKEIEEAALIYAQQGLSETEIIEKLVNRFSINKNAAEFQTREAFKKIDDMIEADNQYMWTFLLAIALFMFGSIIIITNSLDREKILNSNLPIKVKNASVYFPFLCIPLSILFFYKSYRQYKLKEQYEKWQMKNR